ncbi:hypothetical protein [Burkholderia perseverans]|uniref:hypothetical protein n=1 Tax=Burkholderia perseverans TaxID=2615214 RepID=UPI001FEE655F|nr:hypothetical protein [Burkholderia perseverans]
MISAAAAFKPLRPAIDKQAGQSAKNPRPSFRYRIQYSDESRQPTHIFQFAFDYGASHRETALIPVIIVFHMGLSLLVAQTTKPLLSRHPRKPLPGKPCRANGLPLSTTNAALRGE